MVKPISVTALPNYRIHIVFSDGVEGEVDLSDLAGQGIFEAWKKPGFFERVHLGPGRQIQWSDEIELCPDALYLRLTGKTPEELFPRLKHENTHARDLPLLRHHYQDVFRRSSSSAFSRGVWRVRSPGSYRRSARVCGRVASQGMEYGQRMGSPPSRGTSYPVGHGSPVKTFNQDRTFAIVIKEQSLTRACS